MNKNSFEDSPERKRLMLLACSVLFFYYSGSTLEKNTLILPFVKVEIKEMNNALLMIVITIIFVLFRFVQKHKADILAAFNNGLIAYKDKAKELFNKDNQKKLGSTNENLATKNLRVDKLRYYHSPNFDKDKSGNNSLVGGEQIEFRSYPALYIKAFCYCFFISHDIFSYIIPIMLGLWSMILVIMSF